MSDKDTRSIRLSIWINKPVEQVYSALSVPEQLERWLVPKVKTIDSAPRRLTFVFPHHSFDIEFLKLTPNELVEISWFDEKGVGPVVQFELEIVQNGTLVRLIHSGFDPGPDAAGIYVDHVEGWTMYLCNLRCYLDADFDLREGQPGGTIAM